MTTKTRLNLKITIDVEAWNAEYGTKDTALDIREQVKDYIQSAANESVRHLLPIVRIARAD